MSSTLLDHIAAAVADEYALLGTLGTSATGSGFLARERAGGHLVVLAVPAAADELTVLGALGDEVPANAGTCTTCGAPPPTFTAFCLQCGRAFVLNTVGAHRFTHDEVTAAAAHAYDVLGEVAHQAGGSLFFVRDRADGRLVALAGQVDATGGQSLEAVWDALRGDRAAVAPPPDAGYADAVTQVVPAAYGAADFDAPADGVLDVAPPGYPPDFRDRAAESGDGGVRPRRRWAPMLVVAALALAAGGAWATMRGTGRDATVASVPPPGVTTVNAVGPGRASASTETSPPPGGAVATPPPPPIDTPHTEAVAPALSPDSARHLEEQRRRADSARRALSAPAVVQLEGALPAGWTWTVNGRRGPSSVTARLRNGRPNTLTFEAPGYCPETLQVESPVPGSTQRWAPRLTGKPMVGEC